MIKNMDMVIPKAILSLKKDKLYFLSMDKGYMNRLFKGSLIQLTHFYKEGIRICILSQPGDFWKHNHIRHTPKHFKYNHDLHGIYRTIPYKLIGSPYVFTEINPKDLPLYIADATPGMEHLLKG